MTTIATRVLPADVFDTLEFVAEAYGGVGCHERYHKRLPCCIHGLAEFAADGTWDLRDELYRAGIPTYENDIVFLPHETGSRISFSEWCKRLNVVRGE